MAGRTPRRNERPDHDGTHRLAFERNKKKIYATQTVCGICGKPVDKTLKTPHPMSAEVDELIPVSRGGDPYTFANCRLTHRICNRLKSDKTDEHARSLLEGKRTLKASLLPFKTFGI